ncbi:rhomboid-related protein 2-like [Branchiostoma lanceolatum]|uniref:rhomboid-related protein 2-like n=1 Tax=Branchiostoma lanceolatum TaxID=7740 RepID=UPI003453F37C
MGAMEGECYFYDFYDFGGGLGSMIRHAPELEEITVLPETPASPLNTTTTTNTNFNFEMIDDTGPRGMLTPDMIRIEYPQLPLAIEDKWKPLFDKYDLDRDGVISVQRFLRVLRHRDMAGDIDAHRLNLVQDLLQQDEMGNISFQQFVNIMSSKRRNSFRSAVLSRDRCLNNGNVSSYQLVQPDDQPKTCFQKSVHRVAKEVLTEESDRKIYSDYYSCFPPPLLMIILSLVQLGFFVYYAATWDSLSAAGWLSGPVPEDSPFIYNPDKRVQIFRFFTYIVLHAGVEHLVFNLAVQLLLGVPLEMIHGTFRVGAVYLAGALAGSMSTSVIDRTVYLVGGSGGVYALLAGHLANVLTNYTEMQETFGIAKIGLILIITSADVGFSIWRRYNDHPKDTRVSFLAHLFGLLAGLTIGLLILRNFEQKLHERVMWWVSLVVYAACIIFTIFWNIFYY